MKIEIEKAREYINRCLIDNDLDPDEFTIPEILLIMPTAVENDDTGSPIEDGDCYALFVAINGHTGQAIFFNQYVILENDKKTLKLVK